MATLHAANVFQEALTEIKANTCANRIDPVLREADWGVIEGSKIRREMICPGRIADGFGERQAIFGQDSWLKMGDWA